MLCSDQKLKHEPTFLKILHRQAADTEATEEGVMAMVDIGEEGTTGADTG